VTLRDRILAFVLRPSRRALLHAGTDPRSCPYCRAIVGAGFSTRALERVHAYAMRHGGVGALTYEMEDMT
jgi:hypothetical protein